MYPLPPHDLLVKYYNESYRESEYAIPYDGKMLDLPIQFPESAGSFYRFKNFMQCMRQVENKALPIKDDVMIDLGGYQGMFLYAAQQAYGITGVVVDYNENGVNFAKKTLGFKESKTIDDIYAFLPTKKARFVTMVHSLEHVEDPIRLLTHIKKSVLRKEGYLYIEVPNLFGSPLNDPTHFFTYSKKSLENLLRISGFNVLYLETLGNPFAPLTISNNELVLVCLAQQNTGEPEEIIQVDGDKLAKLVEESYAKFSRDAILKQGKKVGKEFFKFGYYFLGHFILEKLPFELNFIISKLKKATGLKIH